MNEHQGCRSLFSELSVQYLDILVRRPPQILNHSHRSTLEMCGTGLHPAPRFSVKQGRGPASPGASFLGPDSGIWDSCPALTQEVPSKTQAQSLLTPITQHQPPQSAPSLPSSCHLARASLAVCVAKCDSPCGSLHQSPHTARGIFLHTKLTGRFLLNAPNGSFSSTEKKKNSKFQTSLLGADRGTDHRAPYCKIQT